MIELVLKRTHTDNINGTAGTLAVKGQFPFCITLEKPWLNNAPQISCIPAGRYHVILTHSPHFEKVLPELQNVPGRSSIRIHSANWHTQLLGCIAVGEAFEVVSGKPGIVDSKGAMDEVMSLITSNKDGVWIAIENHF